MSSPGSEPGPLDGLEQQLDGLLVRLQVGREAALVADGGGQAALVQHVLEVVVRLDAPAQALAEGGGADRHDHELLEVDVVVGVLAAVQDVHHRHRQDVGVGSADVAVEGQLDVARGGLGHGQGDAEDGVGPERCPCCRCRRRSAAPRRCPAGRGRRARRVPRRSSPLTWSTAVETPLPIQASPPSRSSTASNAPVDAPEGTMARPRAPLSRVTSTSTVGLPRESMTCRPTMYSMVLT